KEPFRRKPEPVPEKPRESVVVAPEVMARVLEAKRAPAVEAAGAIPTEFAHLDAGERIPELPPMARKLAWFFLAAVVFAGGLGTAVIISRKSRPSPPVPGGPLLPPSDPGPQPEPAPQPEPDPPPHPGPGL
ncbi:MAG: hypothetical protein FD126_2263, partial [Elusimicrobia bacterium]